MFRVCNFKFWSGLFLQWIFLCLELLFVNANSAYCPGACFCPSLTKNVYCSRKNLPVIPNGIPADTIQLNLNDNPFSVTTLERSNFSFYTRLEQLFLKGCGVEYVSLDTFADLPKLKWLDLSKNRLKSIDDYTFRGLTLEHLFLNDNPGIQLSKNAFGGLRTTGLYIHECAISNLAIEVFKPLNGTLKALWIDKNKIESFGIEWLYLFRKLSHVRLGNNPFHCNCEMKWLFDFYHKDQSTENKIPSKEAPSCRSPANVRGKDFDSLTEDDFACQLPVFKNVDLIFEESVGKLTCLASGDPVPTIHWIKPDNTSQTYPPKSNLVHVKDNEGVMYISNPHSISNVKYQCIASNPAGNVTLSLNVFWPTHYPRDVGIPDVPKTEKPQTLKPTTHSTTSPIKPEEKYVKPVFPKSTKSDKNGKDKDTIYVINATKAGMSMERRVTPPDQNSEYSVVDIIGAVVGTFVLTLIACVVIFHIFYRHHEKIFRDHPPTFGEKSPHVTNLAPAEKLLLQNNQV